MTRPRTVLLISSDEIGWTDLRTILRDLPCIKIIGNATSKAQASTLAATHTPNIIITAATVAGVPVLPLLSELRHTCCPTSKFLIVATSYDPVELVALADLDTAGYLLWSDLSCGMLRHCLAAFIEGDVVLSSRKVAQGFLDTWRGDLVSTAELERLTARERLVLQRLAEGRTRKEIAAMEGLSVRTVKRIVAVLEVKLDAPNQFVLGVKATRWGLVR